jgi:hypothetical protein
MVPPQDRDVAEFDAWLEEVHAAYEFARHQRLRELNGDRVRGWRKDGLHAWSYFWGRIDVLFPAWLHEATVEAPALLAITPPALLDAAEADAYDEFVSRISTSAGDDATRARASRRAPRKP